MKPPTHTKSERGFKQMEPFTDLHGQTVQVVESSLATEPAIWVFVKGCIGGVETDGYVHLSLDMSKRLRETLEWLENNHYHHGIQDDNVERSTPNVSPGHMPRPSIGRAPGGDGKAGGDPCDGCVYEYEDDDRCGSCTRLDQHREDLYERDEEGEQ